MSDIGMSSHRTPDRSASGFYGSRSSSKTTPKKLPQQSEQSLSKKKSTGPSLTPARSQTSVPRRNTDFYGPGVLLEDLGLMTMLVKKVANLTLILGSLKAISKI